MIGNDVSAMSTRRAARTVLVVVLLVAGSAAGTAASVVFAAQPAGPFLTVTVTSSRMSLSAREAPLADVLAAIGRQAGVTMVLRGDLNFPVTETLVNVPVDEGIRRLSRWQSVVLIYGRSTDSVTRPVLSEVWVTSSHPALAGADPGSNRAVARRVSSDDVRAPARPPTEPERWAQTLIAFNSANAETRREQIEALVRAQGESAVVAALRDAATRDPAPRVRRAAIQLLASMGSPAALDAVRATLTDPDPGVRSEARTALRRQSGSRPNDGSGS